MQRESLCIKVPKRQGETVLALTKQMKIINNELQIRSDEEAVFIPVLSPPSENQRAKLRKQVKNSQLLTHVFEEKKKPKPTLLELLEGKLPPHLLSRLPRAMDFVGDIAIVEILPELEAHKRLIGEAILKTRPNARTVLAKAGAVDGTYRLRKFTDIAGEPRTETVHKEYGCRFYVDVAKTYFSPRLAYEHKRVASLVKEGETVIDLFAGVGPFAIHIAKTQQNVKVYAIDVNPHAVEYLERNIRLNKLLGKIDAILGDAKQVARKRLPGVADRVIMNLPEKAFEFVDVACKALKPAGGIVHFYNFVNASDSVQKMKIRFTKEVKDCGRRVVQIPFSRMVRETAPHEWQAVLDAHVR